MEVKCLALLNIQRTSLQLTEALVELVYKKGNILQDCNK